MQEFVNLCDENSFLLKNFPVQSTRLPGAELNESKLRTKDGSSMHGTFGLQTSAVTLKKEPVGINRLLFLIWHAWKTMLHQKAVARVYIR